MNDFPPYGAYAVRDPFQFGTVSYWILRGNGLEAWPIGSAGKYGPPRPPRTSPGSSAEQRRDTRAYWRDQVQQYRLAVLKAIAADPAAAAALWTKSTDRCAACRRFHRPEELPDSAAAGRGRTDEEPLTAEQRRAMVADLRRAGHSEKLIAQFLGISPGTVNKDARRSGIGAPLRPRQPAQNGDQT
jgi:hypothetical protein